MVGMTDYTAGNLLGYVTGKTAAPTLPSVWIALLTAVGSDAGTGFVEVAGGAYARSATSPGTWGAPSGTAPSKAVNSAGIGFPTATASWGSVLAFGLYDAASAGNLLWWDYLGAASWEPFSGAVGSPAVLTAPAHGFLTGDQVVVTAEFGGVLPATSASWAGVLPVTVLSVDTLSLGVATTGTGEGMLRKIVPQAVASGATPGFAAGALVLIAA